MAISIPVFETTKTALQRVTRETLEQVIQTPHGMFYYLKENNPDHILVSGKRPNQVGTILYGFEHLGRDTTEAELALQLGLDSRQVASAISRLNTIIHATFGMKIERVKTDNGATTGKLRITNATDALQASEAYCRKLKKLHTEYVQTLCSYRQNGGNVGELLLQTSNGAALLALVDEVRPLPAAV